MYSMQFIYIICIMDIVVHSTFEEFVVYHVVFGTIVSIDDYIHFSFANYTSISLLYHFVC